MEYRPETVREHMELADLKARAWNAEADATRLREEAKRLRKANELYRHWLVGRLSEERVRAWELLYDDIFEASQKHLDSSA